MKKSPQIYLALDNCCFIKRFVRPLEWMEIAKELGFCYVQASTDNEIDPLFSTSEYMDEWFEEVRCAQQKTGVKVSSFYTGYQTYRTVGLAHHNKSMLEHLKHNWVFEMIERVADLGADGLGFSMFAVPDSSMQLPKQYNALEKQLFQILREIGKFAYEHNQLQVGVEQMYVPYQPPFTIAQTEKYLKNCYKQGEYVSYTTLDTGHMIGQAKFLRPSRKALLESFEEERPKLWLGSDKQYADWHLFKKENQYEKGADAILEGIEEYPYLFADEMDVDEFNWLRRLAKYSPIVHMQQTDGIVAGHASFTPESNKTGIITGAKLLRAIQESYDMQEEIQPPVDKIYLCFELFYSNMATKYEILNQLKQSLNYWRKFIPEDGMTLDEILTNIE